MSYWGIIGIIQNVCVCSDFLDFMNLNQKFHNLYILPIARNLHTLPWITVYWFDLLFYYPRMEIELETEEKKEFDLNKYMKEKKKKELEEKMKVLKKEFMDKFENNLD